MFTQDDIIYAYTREEALDDGVLVDVSETAKEAGFRLPVAITAALYEVINPDHKDFDGRLWDVLWMGAWAARGCKHRDFVLYDLLLQHGRKKKITLKLVMSFENSDGGPCLTIMLPEED